MQALRKLAGRFLQLFSKFEIIQNKKFKHTNFHDFPIKLRTKWSRSTTRPLVIWSLRNSKHHINHISVSPQPQASIYVVLSAWKRPLSASLPHSGLGLNVTSSERPSLSLDWIKFSITMRYPTLVLGIVRLMPPPTPPQSISSGFYWFSSPSLPRVHAQCLEKRSHSTTNEWIFVIRLLHLVFLRPWSCQPYFILPNKLLHRETSPQSWRGSLNPNKQDWMSTGTCRMMTLNDLKQPMSVIRTLFIVQRRWLKKNLRTN